MANKRPQLSEEDRKRVDDYLNSPIHQVERKPFRPWLLLGAIWVIMVIFGVLSYFLAQQVGVV